MSDSGKDAASTHKQTTTQGEQLAKAIRWIVNDRMFADVSVHGNANWVPAHLVRVAILWVWSSQPLLVESAKDAIKSVNTLFGTTGIHSYQTLINALKKYTDQILPPLIKRMHQLMEKTDQASFRIGLWLVLAVDGSRLDACRTLANEKRFCKPKNNKKSKKKKKNKRGRHAKKRKPVSKKKNYNPQPVGPQVWLTLLWHVGQRLPWAWKIGPSYSSERAHLLEMLNVSKLPKNTLICGDAGFVGYDFWNAILAAGGHFLVRVGGNVNLLSERADVKRLGDGVVLCWPKGKMNSGAKPLRLRLVKVKIGKTTMWMLTSVLDRKKLSHKKIIKYYKMRWGVEVEFRGLKQTIDRRNLRCRNSARVYVELDWSIRAMAFAELIALRQQIPGGDEIPTQTDQDYDTKDRSLANTMRALRTCMRNLNKYTDPNHDLLWQLSRALVQKYHNRTNKKARYHPKNPDKKPLGEPQIRKLSSEERARLKKLNDQIAI